MKHRLVLYDIDRDSGGKFVLDIIEWKGESRFDILVVMLRKAHKEMHEGRACGGVLELGTKAESFVPVSLSKGFEAKETWIRNTLLHAIDTLLAR